MDDDFKFEPFPKIGRMSASCTITEKVDGTNASILFDDSGMILVGSRKREIFPEGWIVDVDNKVVKGTDNYGFANWAYSNKEALFEFLGPGRHYGEWAGLGIQRGYGMDTRRFFLFNTKRFGPGRQEIPQHLRDIGLDVVPTIYEGPFDSDIVDDIMHQLRDHWSYIDHYHDPEGIIVYLHGLRQYSKETYEYNKGKWGDK